jgi:hypothetical protein
MPFQVNISATAARDLRSTVRWIAERSPQGAINWRRAFMATVHKLELNAESFGLAPEDSDHDVTVRQALFKTRRGRMFRLVFVVRGTTAYVLYIRDSGQDLIPPEAFQYPPE